MGKKGKRNQNDFFIITLVLFVIGSMIFSYLINTKKKIREESKEELLAGAVQTEQSLSREIQEYFKSLKTIRELLGQEYQINEETAKRLTNLREVNNVARLGLVDMDYVYFDSTGARLPGVPMENLKKTLSGESEIHRIFDEFSGDGIVYSIPYLHNGQIEGAICAKHTIENFTEKVIIPVKNASVMVIDSTGAVFLPSTDIERFINESSWEELYKEVDGWNKKEDFVSRLYRDGKAVDTATSKKNGEMYFAAVSVSEADNLFVVCITTADVVNTKIFSSMFLISLLLVLLLVVMLFLLFYSIVTYVKNKKEIYAVAFIDPLTGLPTKTKHKQDAQVLIDRQNRKYAYVSFDIDNFKYINEMFGYEYGNHVLFQVGSITKDNVKESELCSRVSGDNFAMLLIDEGTKDELKARIQKIFTEVTEFTGNDSQLNMCTLKFSCGVYQINGAVDINTVRANANMARLESKKQVFKEIIFYNEKLKTQRVEERELEYEASAALAKGEFVVYYQPKYEVETEKIIGAEALVRWNHPQRGLLAPSAFIPLFESNGFIIELDMYVLTRCCEMIENWRHRGIKPLCISVNLSRAHLYDQNLMDQILGIVNAHNIPPKYIEFELTETAIYDEMDTLLRTMKAIKKEGFRLSMDDFGSGYSSLNLLRRLPVDVLKLDRGFLEDCDNSADSTRDKRIVVHVISMAKDLEMTVLAEGVETKNQKDFLQSAKCDMIQGFYYARPMPQEEFETLYKRQEEVPIPMPETNSEKQD